MIASSSTIGSAVHRLVRFRTVAVAAAALASLAIAPTAASATAGASADHGSYGPCGYAYEEGWEEHEDFARQGQEEPAVFDTDGGSHKQACLEGPADADFDLYLYAWDNYSEQWHEVASDVTTDSHAHIDYQGDYGVTYAWVVVPYEGSGEYTLWVE